MNDDASLTLIEASQNGPANELPEKVFRKDHASIYNFLRTSAKCKEAAYLDLEIGPAHSRFTGFEYALFQGDWKMAAIFFVHGADPKNNIFDGLLETHASYHGYEMPNVCPGFQGQPIKGFSGLEALVGDDCGGKAHLWIMEYLHKGNLSLPVDYVNLSRCLDAVSSDLKYPCARFEVLVVTTLCSMKRLGFPNDIALKIAESLVLETLWTILESFDCRDVSKVEEEMQWALGDDANRDRRQRS